MLFVSSVFAVIFLMRDAQVLTLRDGIGMAARFLIYGIIQLTAIGLMTALGLTGPGVSRAWTDRQFALVCVLIQIVETGIAYALRELRAGRFGWIGCTLPSPVFLVALLGLSCAVQKELSISAGAAIQLATLSWLSLVCASAILLNRARRRRCRHGLHRRLRAADRLHGVDLHTCRIVLIRVQGRARQPG